MQWIATLPPWLFMVYVLALGLTVGSFLNVCIHRLPRGESVVAPRSRCPACAAAISWRDNIPLLSYLLLGGRCRHCGAAIAWRYPAVEAATGVLFLAVYRHFGWTWHTPIYWVAVAALVAITLIDWEHQIIPDAITLPGIVFGLAAGAWTAGIWNSVSGFLLGGGLFYLIAVLSRGGMGGGDIKFIAAAGALLGWKQALLVIFLGSLLGSLYGLPFLLLGKKGRKSRIPFGPFLALATLIAIFAGDPLIRLYIAFVAGG